MGCCCSKTSSSVDNDIEDNLLSDNDVNDRNSDNNNSNIDKVANSPLSNSGSSSGGGSRYIIIDEQVGPTGEDYPIWIKDDTVHECYNCDLKFNITERKHHCRRCRNIFCYSCTSYKANIILYNIKNDVKVCNSCKTVLQAENHYLLTQQPMLFNGELFVRYRMLGFTKHMIKLKLLHGSDILIYSDVIINNDSNSNNTFNVKESTEIKLTSIIKINSINLTTFEIVTKAKNYSFEADCISTMKLWVEALTKAIYYHNQPTLRQQIEIDRKYKDDEKNKLLLQQEQAKVHQINKDNRFQALNNIRNKYGIT